MIVQVLMAQVLMGQVMMYFDVPACSSGCKGCVLTGQVWQAMSGDAHRSLVCHQCVQPYIIILSDLQYKSLHTAKTHHKYVIITV